MKYTKGLINCYIQGYGEFSLLAMIGTPLLPTFALFTLLIDLTLGICEGVNKGFRALKSKPLKKIKTTKIEPHVLTSDVCGFNPELIKEICHEIVRDQVGHSLDIGETVEVIGNVTLADSSEMVMFVYRRHDQSGSFGASKDKISSSVHTVRLSLNRIGRFVHIEIVQSLDAKDLTGLTNPQSFLRDTLVDQDRFTKQKGFATMETSSVSQPERISA